MARRVVVARRQIVPRRPVTESLESRTLLSVAVSFAPAVSFAAGTTPVALTAADFNADGHQDLAVADATTEKVDVFFGSSSGTAFTAGPVLSLSAPPTAILTGDFNGDGRPDIAVATSAGTSAGTAVTLFLNSGSGTFGLGQSTTVEAGAGSTEPIAIAADDFNADGHLDLVATEYSDNAVGVLLGAGTGTFAAPATFNVGSEPTAVAVADFNGDGRPDVAVTDTLTAATGTSTATNGGDAVQVLTGTGSGQFTTGSITNLSAAGSDTLVAADLNGDGRPDLVAGNADGTVSVLTNDGTGTFTLKANPTAAAASTGLAVSDLNLDGTPDVATTDGGTALSGGTDAVTVFPGAGGGTVSAASQYSVGSLPEGLVAADLNGDGRPDLATANADGTVSVLLNTTAVAQLATRTTLSVTPTTTPSGSPVTLTATVTPTSVSPLTGESSPTGTVTFYSGTTAIGTATLAAVAVDPTAGTKVSAGTAVATLTTTALAVGADRLTARYAADTAYSASASAAVTTTVTATATSGPNLVPTILSTTLPGTLAPGETGTVTVKIANQGNATAAGTITDTLVLSLDPLLDDADTTLAVKGSLAKTAVRLTAGHSVTVTGTFTVPADTPLGTYVLLVDANAGGTVSESDTADNVAASPTSFNVVDQFGTVGGRRNVALTVTDAAGRSGTFRLTGPGTGTVTLGDAGVDLSLTGTTAASALTVAPATGGTFALHDLAADAAIGKVTAPAVGVDDGTITLPAGATSVSLGAATASSLTAGGGIGTLAVSSWTTGSVSAPWITTLRSAGAFGPTVDLTATGSALSRVPHGDALFAFTIGGGDAAAVTVAAGRIGSVRVTGGITGTISAAAGSIASVTVAGPVADGVRFTAAAFPRRAVLDGAAVDPTTDSHFRSSTTL